MNLRNFKLLVTDVDGTVLDSNHKLHPETAVAFAKLRDFGVLTTLATGKIFPAIENLIRPLCGDLPFLVGHSSIAQDQRGEILMQHGLSPEVMAAIKEVGEKHQCDFGAYLPDRILAKEYNHNMEYLTEYWEPRAEEVETWPDLGDQSANVIKVLFVNRDSDVVLERVAQDLEEVLEGRAVVQFSIPHLVEVTNIEAKKENGLQFLSTHLGIRSEEMIAVGDGLNDVGMLQYAGFGVAMGNASPELIAVADEVIGTNNENGLAKAIERWIAESN